MSANSIIPCELSVSVDVPDDCHSDAGTRLLAQLHGLLSMHNVPATWSASTEQLTKLVLPIIGNESSNVEFGLLVTSQWSRPALGRTVLARMLQSAMAISKDAGLRIQTLALHETDLVEAYDLLVKHQLRVIRGRCDVTNSLSGTVRPTSLRYGVWQTAPSIVIPTRSRWSLPWAIKTSIRKGLGEGNPIHVAICGSQLLKNVEVGLRSIEYTFKALAKHRQSGELRAILLSQLVELYSASSNRSASQSILRAA